MSRTRTLRIPLAGPLPNEFWNDLRQSISLATKAVNFVLTRCASSDMAIWVPSGKVAPCPKLYFYKEISSWFPGATGIAASISREAEKTYRQCRFDMLRGRKSLPVRRSTPWPILRSMSEWSLDDDNNILVSFKLLGGRHQYRLRGGSNYARQINPLRAWIKAGDLDRIRDSEMWIDNNGVVIGVSVCFDDVKNEHIGTLKVKTARDSLLVAIRDADDTPFVFNGDHIKRWHNERFRRMRRLRQDRKCGSERSVIDEQMSDERRKLDDRTKSAIFEAVSHVVRHAKRRRCNKIEFDDMIQSYFKSFPWFMLRERMRVKCEDEGIEFAHVAPPMIAPDIDEPHVYFKLAIDAVTRKPLGKIKIGQTGRDGVKRKKELAFSGGHDLIYLAADKQPKSSLRKRETEYHAQFADCCIKIDDRRSEWFSMEPVLGWLREVGCIGNTGNLSQIQQYLEVH